MAASSDASLRVLHALRLKWAADIPALVAATCLPAAAVESHLRDLEGDGLVIARSGRIQGFGLTDAGREHHLKLIRDELDASGQAERVHGAYRSFLGQNRELLSLATAWQMRTSPEGEAVFNDHRDRDYDAHVLARLDAVHVAVQPVLADLASALDRFSPYGPRLQSARDRLRQGQLDWLTRPLIDSYHTVWFELHEDLLVTLGLTRKEGET